MQDSRHTLCCQKEACAQQCDQHIAAEHHDQCRQAVDAEKEAKIPEALVQGRQQQSQTHGLHAEGREKPQQLHGKAAEQENQDTAPVHLQEPSFSPDGLTFVKIDLPPVIEIGKALYRQNDAQDHRKEGRCTAAAEVVAEYSELPSPQHRVADTVRPPCRYNAGQSQKDTHHLMEKIQDKSQHQRPLSIAQQSLQLIP